LTLRRFLSLAACVAVAVLVAAQARTTLDIYVVDVEGGNPTLFVAPSGQSLLIDSGNGGAGASRDAGRIIDAARDAGITQKMRPLPRLIAAARTGSRWRRRPTGRSR
jgi:hypothetical protein